MFLLIALARDNSGIGELEKVYRKKNNYFFNLLILINHLGLISTFNELFTPLVAVDRGKKGLHTKRIEDEIFRSKLLIGSIFVNGLIIINIYIYIEHIYMTSISNLINLYIS